MEPSAPAPATAPAAEEPPSLVVRGTSVADLGEDMAAQVGAELLLLKE